MNGITGETIINAASAIGAGIAVCSGIGPGIGQGIGQGMVLPQLDVTRVQRVTSCQQCFLDRR